MILKLSKSNLRRSVPTEIVKSRNEDYNSNLMIDKNCSPVRKSRRKSISSTEVQMEEPKPEPKRKSMNNVSFKVDEFLKESDNDGDSTLAPHSDISYA